MAVLISGANGFLGRHLLDRLVADGREIIAVARCPAPLRFESHPCVRWIVRDIARDGFDPAGLPSINAVVHLAGATLGAGNDEDMFLQANETTTVRLCQALSERTDRFIFASSQVVYGDVRHIGVTEEFPLRPNGSAYACSKLNSENWLRWFQKRHGGSYLALRFCGFTDGGGLVDYLIERALSGEVIELFARGGVRRDYLPSAEAVDVLATALDCASEPGFLPVNIGSGQAVSALELARLVCAEVGTSSRIELLAHPSPQGDFVFCIDRARRILGFNPGCLADAVRLYARHRKTQPRVNDAKS